MAPETAGNPCSDEKWVRSRLRGLSEALHHRACPTTISRLLRDQKYGLRSHRKVLHTGKQHAERDRQFRHIAEQREEFRGTGDPRISVDTKKKELVGQFKNPGQTWCPQAEKVNDHDFLRDAAGRAAPYGVYDPERNEGHVCVTMSSDTADLAVDAVVDWWRLSQPNYPQATRLMIEADSGGSNAARSRRYKAGGGKHCYAASRLATVEQLRVATPPPGFGNEQGVPLFGTLLIAVAFGAT